MTSVVRLQVNVQYLIKVVSELSVEELIALKVNVVHTIRPATSSHILPAKLENLVFPYRVSCPDPFPRGVWALGPNM